MTKIYFKKQKKLQMCFKIKKTFNCCVHKTRFINILFYQAIYIY